MPAVCTVFNALTPALLNREGHEALGGDVPG